MSGIDETVQVPELNAGAFVARIGWMNDRARRLGARARVALEETARGPGPVPVTSRVFRDGSFLVETRVETRPCVSYRLTCPEPVIALAGWTWAGWIAARRAEKDSVSGGVDAPVHHADLLRPIPAATVDRAFDARGRMVCDHCGTFRNRRMGFVVRDGEGLERVVGSSCLLDHTGHDPKAVLAAFRSISLLREAMDLERRHEDFVAAVYDRDAHMRSERDAAAARDAVLHPVRTIVLAVLLAMDRQGFYARSTGEGRTATEEGVRAILAAPVEAPDEMRVRAGEILDWFRPRAGAGLPEDPDGSVSLAGYLAADPGFRIVEDYRMAGFAPLGRRYADGEVAEVTYLGREEAGVTVATAWGTKEVDRSRHLFRDDVGSRLVWETASNALDGALVAGGTLRVRFRAGEARIDRARVSTRIRNLRPA
jgi:hypothetical protein